MAATGATSAGSIWRPRWILGSWQDLLLFVATPVAILPLIALFERGLSTAEIALYVAAFGALGHHLPGMMRAYGDRELFARFRTRFVVSPLFLLTVCVYGSLRHPDALYVMVTLWGTWHGLAQVYGFARIYDAKLGQPSWLTTRLDLWLCAVWFGVGLLFSPGRVAELLGTFYAAGGPLLAPEWLGAARSLWIVATAAVTTGFVVNTVVEWRRGRPCSLVKPLLFASSFGFWWYAMVTIENVLLGVALFEVFHDIQYLAIVWGYNSKRVATGHRLGGLMRFLFRRSYVLIGLYVGLVFAYGSTRLAAMAVPAEQLRAALLGVVTASTLLHFYFDAFIWSVRDADTREALGIGGAGAAEMSLRSSLSSWAPAAAKWALFVVPLAVLSVAGSLPMANEIVRRKAVVATLPDSAEARVEYARALEAGGRSGDAVREYRSAIELQPERAAHHANLGLLHVVREEWNDAEAALAEALRLEPDLAAAHESMGRVLLAREEFETAAGHFEAARAAGGDAARAEYLLGATWLARGFRDEAAAHFLRALELGSEQFVGTLGARLAFGRLATAYDEAGDRAEGARWRRRAVGLAID